MTHGKNSFDIIIVGGGMVGLSLAATLAKHNFSIAIVESKKPLLNWDDSDLTARVSAIHHGSKSLLDYTDAWQHIDKKSRGTLAKMLVWDHAGATLDIDSQEAGYTEMGWIVENRAIVKALLIQLKKMSNVIFYSPNIPKDLQIEDNRATLTLADNKILTASLVVGADGANSWVRRQMPVKITSRSYHHKAIVSVIRSEKMHNNTAYQQFLTTGPVALLPLANPYETALVWSADNALSDELLNLPEALFNEKLTSALDNRLGKLSTQGKRHQFSLTMRHAADYTSAHCALVGDAAHTIHPLAGQGVNLGFMDAACLAQTLIDIKSKKQSIGAHRSLRRYTRWRKAENTTMIAAMRLFKSVFSNNTTTVNTARHIAIGAINECSTVKLQIMHAAMGKSDDLPEFLLATID